MSKENKGRRKKSLSTSKSKVKMIKSTKLKVKKPKDVNPQDTKPKVKKPKVKKLKDQSNINPELQTNNIKQTETKEIEQNNKKSVLSTTKEIEQNNKKSVLSTKLQEPEKAGWDQLAKQAEERSENIAEQGRKLGSNPLSRAFAVAKLSQVEVNDAGKMVENKANAIGVNKLLAGMKSVTQAAGLYKPKKTTETSGPINVSNLNNKL